MLDDSRSSEETLQAVTEALTFADSREDARENLAASFADCVILMTTNIGRAHFLDKPLGYDAAMAAPLDGLEDMFRPEFLNRFNGRQNIIGCNSLPLELIEKIAERELRKVNERIARSGSAITIHMDGANIAAVCKDRYDPVHGAQFDSVELCRAVGGRRRL